MTEPDRTETIPPLHPPRIEEHLAPGTVIGGRYEVRGFLGRGGHGAAYRVFDREVKREVALKILHPERETPSALARLRREVRVARDAVSPRLVRIFDLGTSPQGTYLTMELVEGLSLKELLRDGPLPVEEAVRIATELFEGLKALHALPIVHRDVKPANILISEKGEVKLADFGLARRLDRDETQITRIEGVVGTLDYLSPEQALGEELGPASDLYSAGLVLFEMLTGRLPYEAKSDLGALLAHLRAKPPDVRELRPEVPGWLAKVVRRLLEKNPHDRYPGAEAVAADLLARRRPRVGQAVKRRLLWVAGGVLLLVALLVVVATWSEGRRFSHLLPENPDRIRAFDTRGQTLWTLRGVNPEEAYHAGMVRLEPGGKPLLAIVLHRPRDWRPEEAATLSFLDPATGRVVSQATLPSGADSFPSFSNRFHPHTLFVYDLNQDGVDEVIVTYKHSPEWPSYTVLYEPRLGRGRVVFFGTGHHRIVGAEDIDGDGHRELLLAGIANGLGWYNALAVVRLDPWIDEDAGQGFEAAASPDMTYSETQRRALAWYALLPRGALLETPEEVAADSQRWTLTVRYRSGAKVVLGYDGFPPSPAGAAPLPLRQEARSKAWRHLRESIRLAAIGRFDGAVSESALAIAEAKKAQDPRLEECLTRFHGKHLVADGRLGEAEALFTRLVSNSEWASEIAFDAGEAFHLRGELEKAAQWYRRGLELADAVEQGKSKHEFLKGEVLALVEFGRFDEAMAAVDRFKAAYRAQGIEACREYIRWRRGEAPRLDRLDITSGNIDLFRYWKLEFEHVRGREPQEILGEVEKELAYGSEVKAEFLSLKGELLAAMGRMDEARDAAERAAEIARADRATNTTARAHFDLITERLARLSRDASGGRNG